MKQAKKMMAEMDEEKKEVCKVKRKTWVSDVCLRKRSWR